MNFEELCEDMVKVSDGYMSCMFFCKKYDCPEVYVKLYDLLKNQASRILSSPLCQ
jgi:hypothetical protein